MNDQRIHADSFVLTKRRIRIYRVRYQNTTVFWTSGEKALTYMRSLRAQRLQAKHGR